MRAGDAVFHRPSGERWVLAYAENGKVSACGWPESVADEGDCEVLEAATDSEHVGALRRWIKEDTTSLAMTSNDHRVNVCRRQLAAIDPAFAKDWHDAQVYAAQEHFRWALKVARRTLTTDQINAILATEGSSRTDNRSCPLERQKYGT